MVTEDGLIQRRALPAVETALDESRVVLVQGARQAGKSTLVRMIADARPDAVIRTLDDLDLLRAAHEDPKGFVERGGLLVIDEVQRAPELLLAVKQDVDANPRPGRFLLTGSSRVLAMKGVPDSLPGRMQTVELWPFSQGEIDGSADGFVEAVFREGAEVRHDSGLTRADYAERVLRGGFPEAVSRRTQASRRRFLTGYLETLLEREIAEIAEVQRLAELRSLVGLLAARSGGLLVPGNLASELQLSAVTVGRYVGLLEEIFVIKRIPAWSRNLSTRIVGTAKLAFVDSALAATVLGEDRDSLLEPTSSAFGPLLEGFVASELMRQLSRSELPVELRHYRTRDQVEVDLVLEHARGRVIGLEVKAAATIRAEDFRGLRHLADRLGDDLVAGILLYAGRETLSFGPRLLAMPVSAVWELA
ncbi:ATP-binding protein [Hamadaea sp. NPDC050747]|uniref:ATP-binding protein n=1 Tax=Hamadaea sp. NPDC050747 TaxID=3155789 RepID=UPI0033E467BD